MWASTCTPALGPANVGVGSLLNSWANVWEKQPVSSRSHNYSRRRMTIFNSWKRVGAEEMK